MFNDDYCLSETVIGKGRNGEVLFASDRQYSRKKNCRKNCETRRQCQDSRWNIWSFLSKKKFIGWKKVQNIEGCQKCVAFHVDEKKNAVTVTEYQENTIDLCRFIYNRLIPIKEHIKWYEISDPGYRNCLVVEQFVVMNCRKERPSSIVTETLKNGIFTTIANQKNCIFMLILNI